MIDVSDGLLGRPGARRRGVSGVAIDLDVAALRGGGAGLRDAAAALGVDPLEWVLTGGEDHALVATFPSARRCRRAGRWSGRCSPWAGSSAADDAAQHRVTVAGLPAGAYQGPGGWRHFSG